MYRGQTEDVGQIRLRKGQPDRVILGHADRPLPPNELAQDIGHTPARGAAPERDNALPQHGLLLHRTRRYGVRSRLPAGGRRIRTLSPTLMTRNSDRLIEFDGAGSPIGRSPFRPIL